MSVQERDMVQKRFEALLEDQGAEFYEKLRVYEQINAHELYSRFRESGYTSVELLRGDGIWVEDAAGPGMHDPSVSSPDEIFEQWLDEYGLGSAERLLNESGSNLDLSQDPYGVPLEQLEARRGQILREAPITSADATADDDALMVSVGAGDTLEACFPDLMVSRSHGSDEARFGIGGPTGAGNAPLTVRLDHYEQTIEACDGTNESGSKHALSSTHIHDWPTTENLNAEMFEELTRITGTHGHLAYYREPQHSAEELHAAQARATISPGATGTDIG